MCYSALVKRDLDYLGRKYGAIVIRDQIEDYHRAAAENPKRFPPLDDRIFPGHYAPVIYERDGKRVLELMRYGAYPKSSVVDPKSYTTFNARRDNLTSSFWDEAFMKRHGFVVLDGFYEWVKVQDLLKAGVVAIEEVRSEFQRQADERKAKIIEAGKKYKPTPTELKDPRFRQIIIEFKPMDGRELLVPAIFSATVLENGRQDKGFAVVTDEPPPEVRAAGHDRCPMILEAEAVAQWLGSDKRTPKQWDEVLARGARVTFKHKLAEAA
ncbi:MAG: SOS response-associated peptidase family protein [Oligoflexales bacterium]